MQVCKLLGIPLAMEKVAGPIAVLDFLGILLDIIRLKAHLPDDKLLRVRNTIAEWLDKKKVTKREILSLVGLLQHAPRLSNQVVHSLVVCIALPLEFLNWITTHVSIANSVQICIGGIPSCNDGMV